VEVDTIYRSVKVIETRTAIPDIAAASGVSFWIRVRYAGNDPDLVFHPGLVVAQADSLGWNLDYWWLEDLSWSATLSGAVAYYPFTSTPP
jgi:hypothetical protein